MYELLPPPLALSQCGDPSHNSADFRSENHCESKTVNPINPAAAEETAAERDISSSPDPSCFDHTEKSRRQFLSYGAAIAGVSIVPRHVLGGHGYIAPSERVRVGIVGAGGRGKQNVEDLLKLEDVEITAIADPAESWDLSPFYYKGLAGRLPVAELIQKRYSQKSEQPKTLALFEDFRVMLDEQKEIDAILCATPDHLHAYVSLISMHRDKHVYCEKPLTHNIREAREVARVSKLKKVATQMGNQGHANHSMRETVEWIRAGAIGNVHEVHAWTSSSRWNPTLQGKPSEFMEIPKGLQWDLWCGPRIPWNYHRAIAPVSWRDFWPFGLGSLGDIGCHDLDSAVWSLNLNSPKSIEVHPVGISNRDIVGHGEIGYFEFDAIDEQPKLSMRWYSGGAKPPMWPGLNSKLPARGTLFVGEKGYLLCGGAGGSQKIYPEATEKSFVRPPQSIPRSNGHHREWIDAIKGGPTPLSNFEYGARLTEIVLLGCLSMQLGEKIYWDHASMKAIGLDHADQIIQGEYRNGWGLPT